MRFIRNYTGRNKFKEFSDLTPEQAFTRIYEMGMWGQSGDPSKPYFSGTGSHDEKVVAPYLGAVKEFLETFDGKPDVVDLGCGDFTVGSRLRPFCANYIACDVVPKLIDFNREKFKRLDVDFRALDLTTDVLPPGEVVFIRQVLQHLSNEHILRVLPKLSATYQYLVLTEHLPGDPHFQPNLDKPAGPGIRTGINSGIVLTSPPFNFRPKAERRLCQAREADGLIVTTLYVL
jgi:hypothetical protein